jgi:nitroimidazol reductase NimA-like FMN-containing flavoprotein (pyridoxamine 5'-phosphate oxidase superfamily)
MVEDDAIRILDTHRIMAISTVRPDGWPQTTIVGYANVGLTIYFMIFRSSQKFANIQRDDRISIAIGEEPRDVRELNAAYAGAHAAEVVDPGDREDAWRLLRQRHPNLADFEPPEPSEAAVMRAECKYVSILDYRMGPGYRRSLTIGDDSAAAQLAAKGGPSTKPSRPIVPRSPAISATQETRNAS